jgi:hypothetical protein
MVSSVNFHAARCLILKFQTQEILEQPSSSADDVTLLMKELQGLMLTNHIEWDDGEV